MLQQNGLKSSLNFLSLCMLTLPSSILTWTTNLVLQLYNISYGMWKHCNTILYDKVESNMNQKESEKLLQDIAQFYNMGKTQF